MSAHAWGILAASLMLGSAQSRSPNAGQPPKVPSPLPAETVNAQASGGPPDAASPAMPEEPDKAAHDETESPIPDASLVVTREGLRFAIRARVFQTSNRRWDSDWHLRIAIEISAGDGRCHPVVIEPLRRETSTVTLDGPPWGLGGRVARSPGIYPIDWVSKNKQSKLEEEMIWTENMEPESKKGIKATASIGLWEIGARRIGWSVSPTLAKLVMTVHKGSLPILKILPVPQEPLRPFKGWYWADQTAEWTKCDRALSR